MDNQLNPLSKIPVFTNIMQILVDVVYHIFLCPLVSFWYFGSCPPYLDCGICITVATFKTAKQERYTGGYGNYNGGEHE